MIQELLSKTVKNLIFKEPFYGLFLSGLNKVYDENIPTAGVSKNNINAQLTINPKFFSSLSKEHKYGLIKHELLHIAFGHLLVRESYDDHKLFNIAADLEINQYIDFENLPEGGLLLSTFPNLNLPVKAGTKTYYKLLKQAQEEEDENLLDLLEKMDGSTQYDHSTWEEFENLNESEKKLIQKQIEHQIKEAAIEAKKSCGSIPGEIEHIFDKINKLEPEKFNWKGYLRRFVGKSNISYTKKLRRKYNKRYIGNPGLKIKFKSHILVAIDTSASVNDDDLKEFINEIHHIYKTGNKVTIIQCDTQINDISVFNPKNNISIKGRGGTEFQPVIDHYNASKIYTCLIYLTDGEAYAPTNCPHNTLWVHSTQSYINESLPGFKIKLN